MQPIAGRTLTWGASSPHVRLIGGPRRIILSEKSATFPDHALTRHMPRYFVTLIVAVALFMETMDSTVIATSLPAIAA